MSHSDAEDLLQDCWMRIHRARHTYRSSEPLLPWIYAIARHTRLDAYRRRRRLQSREVLVAETPEPAPANAAPDSNIWKLVERLPHSQREVVMMLQDAGLSLQEGPAATPPTTRPTTPKAPRPAAAR